MYCTLHLEHCIIYDFYVCQPIIFNLFILIILNLVTVSFDFYLAFTAPDEGEFCLTEILSNKITLLSCPISLAIGFCTGGSTRASRNASGDRLFVFLQGGYFSNIGWECAARFWKPLPYFRPKYVIFPTLFQT